jgi:hypothetical protein
LTPTPFTTKLNVFGSLASIEEVSMGLSKLYCHFYRQNVLPNETFNPFNWWVKCEHQFSNIGFLAHQ